MTTDHAIIDVLQSIELAVWLTVALLCLQIACSVKDRRPSQAALSEKESK